MENLTTPNVYVPKNRASKYPKKTGKGEICRSQACFLSNEQVDGESVRIQHKTTSQYKM